MTALPLCITSCRDDEVRFWTNKPNSKIRIYQIKYNQHQIILLCEFWNWEMHRKEGYHAHVCWSNFLFVCKKTCRTFYMQLVTNPFNKCKYHLRCKGTPWMRIKSYTTSHAFFRLETACGWILQLKGTSINPGELDHTGRLPGLCLLEVGCKISLL